MPTNASETIDDQINAKLKRIMQQRNIHNEVTEDNDQEDTEKIDSENVEEEIVNEEQERLVDRNARSIKIHPINQIIYGAPGTGKTYSTVEYAIAILENREVNLQQLSESERKDLIRKYEDLVKKGFITFTTFHQSYGYEEFIQGIRPDIKAGTVRFKVMAGVFKTIDDKAMHD